jgi:hypothetical protein
MFIVALLQQPSYGNSQDALQPTNGSRKCGFYTQWNFTQPQRGMKFCHSEVMDRSREHHHEQSLPSSEGQKIACSPSFVDYRPQNK